MGLSKEEGNWFWRSTLYGYAPVIPTESISMPRHSFSNKDNESIWFLETRWIKDHHLGFLSFSRLLFYWFFSLISVNLAQNFSLEVSQLSLQLLIYLVVGHAQSDSWLFFDIFFFLSKLLLDMSFRKSHSVYCSHASHLSWFISFDISDRKFSHIFIISNFYHSFVFSFTYALISSI